MRGPKKIKAKQKHTINFVQPGPHLIAQDLLCDLDLFYYFKKPGPKLH